MGKRAEVRLEDLAAVIASTVKGVKPVRPIETIAAPAAPPRYDGITRACILDRIRRLRRTWRSLELIVEQATFNRPGLDALDDDELAALLRDMERGRECLTEGVCFEDAGLIRNMADELPEE